MAARYTYLAADLLTNEIYGELPLHGVTFDRVLNDVGNFQGSANLDNDFLSNEVLLSATAPGRTAVYIYRNDTIIWGGIIWSRTYQSQAKALSLYGQTFESYAERRRYRPSTQRTYIDKQSALINLLWAHLQGDPQSNIGVLPGTNLPAWEAQTKIVVKPWELKSYHDFIQEILNTTTGLDYTIECYESLGVPQKQLRLGKLGAKPANTNLILDYPGNILNYYYTESAARGCNAAWSIGDGDNSDAKIGYAEDAVTLASGFPRLERVETHAGVTVQATIDAHASYDLLTHPLPTVTRTFEVKPDEEPQLGSFALGDWARVHLLDPRFPDGLDEEVRVLGWNVTPGGSDGVEELSLVLEEEDE